MKTNFNFLSLRLIKYLANSSDNVTAKPKNNASLLDGIDFNSMGSSNKTASTNEIFNMSSASAGNKAQNATTNNIFDTLGEVFAKSSSPNSNYNF